MTVKLAFAFFLLPFLDAPVYAQSLRVECFKAAQDQLKQCLDSAIAKGVRILVRRRDSKDERRSPRTVSVRLKEA